MDIPERIKNVNVSVFGEHSGLLTQPAQYVFQYDSPHPVSLTMKFRDEPYNLGAIHPVFAQNLPEGFVRRYIYEKLQRHAQVNDLYLLALQGESGVGHLQYYSSYEKESQEVLSLSDILAWQEKESIFPQLLDRYYLGGFASGVQPKVVLDGVRATVNQHDIIVKTFDAEFDLLTVNEFVCMSAAKAAGLSPPKFWLSENLNTFVIERFDRKDGEQLAFEDFTILTKQEKYTSSYEMLLKAVNIFTSSHLEVIKAYKYIVFNCLIGNGDAHLKNFALQYDSNRTNIELTPPYDITHTQIYPTIDDKMALKMGGAKNFPDKADLLKLGKLSSIKQPELIIEEIADSIQTYLDSSVEVSLMKGLKESLLTSLGSACASPILKKSYRHDKKRKYDKPQPGDQ